jgi:hypothetical protein
VRQNCTAPTNSGQREYSSTVLVKCDLEHSISAHDHIKISSYDSHTILNSKPYVLNSKLQFQTTKLSTSTTVTLKIEAYTL